MASLGRKRGKSLSAIPALTTTAPSPPQLQAHSEAESLRVRSRVQDAQPTMASVGAELVAALPTPLATASTASAAVSAVVSARRSGVPLARRASAAESSLELLRNRDARKPLHDRAYQTMSRLYAQRQAAPARGDVPPSGGPAVAPRHPVSSSPDGLEGRAVLSDPVDSEQSSGGRSGLLAARQSRIGREPSAPHGQLQGPAQFPLELLPLLDGEHHTDEICTRFEVGWPMLRQWLFAAGGAQEGDEGDEEYGQISIIYR